MKHAGGFDPHYTSIFVFVATTHKGSCHSVQGVTNILVGLRIFVEFYRLKVISYCCFYKGKGACVP
jgi:hypothetical protein